MRDCPAQCGTVGQSACVVCELQRIKNNNNMMMMMMMMMKNNRAVLDRHVLPPDEG